jgi:threonine dehydratase
MVSLDDVHAAREAIGGRLHRTPTFSSAVLGARVGAPVFLKAELFQKTGSFKPRGMLNVLAHLSAEDKQRGVITISAGNAAQSLAYCSALGEIDCLVVMWQGASEAKLAATREYGAEIDLEAASPAEAFERVAELREQTGRVFVHSRTSRNSRRWSFRSAEAGSSPGSRPRSRPSDPTSGSSASSRTFPPRCTPLSRPASR